MRDALLVAYVSAAGALIGYSQKTASLGEALSILIPFIALGAATMIAQHQDQIVAFNQYISLELAKDLPDAASPVVDFSASRAVSHLAHNLWMNLFAQLILIGGPAAFVLWERPLPFQKLVDKRDIGNNRFTAYFDDDGANRHLEKLSTSGYGETAAHHDQQRQTTADPRTH